MYIWTRSHDRILFLTSILSIHRPSALVYTTRFSYHSSGLVLSRPSLTSRTISVDDREEQEDRTESVKEEEEEHDGRARLNQGEE